MRISVFPTQGYLVGVTQFGPGGGRRCCTTHEPAKDTSRSNGILDRSMIHDWRQSGHFFFWTRTTMSGPHLPPELLDLIIDLSHQRESVLRNCCLISKSWISRTRKHLFAKIRFNTVEKLQSWKGKFPDPSTSPTRYTKALFIHCPHGVTTADAGEGGWIRAFSKVGHLEVGGIHQEMSVFLPQSIFRE